MAWKKRYETVEKGDIVELLKYGCNEESVCCRSRGYEIGNKYEVSHVNLTRTKARLRTPTNNCWFDIHKVKKIRGV